MKVLYYEASKSEWVVMILLAVVMSIAGIIVSHESKSKDYQSALIVFNKIEAPALCSKLKAMKVKGYEAGMLMKTPMKNVKEWYETKSSMLVDNYLVDAVELVGDNEEYLKAFQDGIRATAKRCGKW